jgi:16S rRNA processing protein RimM
MDNYYVVGTIIGTHALKGEVKVYSVTDFKENRFKKGSTLYIEKDGQMIKVTVKTHREHKETDLISFLEYNTINDVEQFKKCKLYVDESDIHDELDEDEFYYRQIIGCKIVYNNETIGEVKDIVNYGASDLLVITHVNGKEIMIPFVDEFILAIDLEEQIIEIDVIEGLLGE